MPHAIEYVDHTANATLSRERFRVRADRWRDGVVWAHERITLTAHSGTPMEAPTTARRLDSARSCCS